jgi:hypothetical protein
MSGNRITVISRLTALYIPGLSIEIEVSGQIAYASSDFSYDAPTITDVSQLKG